MNIGLDAARLGIYIDNVKKLIFKINNLEYKAV